MIKFIITNFNDYRHDLLSQVSDKETIILTSKNQVINYKKVFSSNNNVQIYDLKTLIYQIYHENLNQLPILNQSEQTLFFIKAIKELPKLKYLNNHVLAMIDDLITIYQEETNYLLKKNDYQTKVTNEINLIFDKYLSLIDNKYLDEQLLYKEVLLFLKNNKIYASKNLIISDIYYFNEIEKEIIINIINNSNNSYFYFLNLDKKSGLEIPFTTFEYFKKAFKNKYQLEILNHELDQEKEFIINNLYNFNPKMYPKSNHFNLYGASDLYDEVVFIANQINHLIQKNNYRYSDFAIVSNNIKDYENYFDLIFTDNNIYYHQPITLNYHFFDYILRLLKIMDNNYTNETIINLLKTNYYNLNDVEINQIIKNFERNDELESPLKDFLYNKILNPLLIKDYKLSDLLNHLYKYLETFKINEIINKNSPETWNEFIDILNNLYSIYENDDLSLQELYEIFQYFFNKSNQKNHYLDEVLVGNLKIINSLVPKVVFFIGVNEGLVPKQEKANLLLNHLELNQSYQNYPQFDKILIDQFETFYTIICPSDKIYLSYCKIYKDGSKVNEAPLIKQIKNMYQEQPIYNQEKSNEIIGLKNLTYNHYLTFDNLNLIDTLKTYFSVHPDYQEYNKLIAYLPNFYKVNKVNLTHLDYLSLSPSSMDTYNYCAFQYFCKYILKLKKDEPFKYDYCLVGTYIHYLLQNLVHQGATRDNIKGLLAFLKNEFIKTKEIEVSNLIDYMFNNLNRSLLKLWPLIYDELNNNKFVPEKLEFNLSSARDRALVLKYNQLPIYINGIIDRVDKYDDYIRVIDYKTGKKELDLNDLVQGLNFQLLIYLLFFKYSEPTLKPAGVFYLPSLVKYDNIEFKPDNYRLTGMFLNEDKIIEALGGENINHYVDAYSRNKFKEKVLFDSSDMEELLDFTETSLLKTASKILNGEIEVNPFKNNNFCQYCPYQSICGIEENSKNYRFFKKYTEKEQWEIIRGLKDELD